MLFNWRWKQLLTELQINEILNSNRGFKNDFWFNSLVLSNWRRNIYIIIMIVWMKNMSEKLNAHHFVAMYANMNVIVVKIWFNVIEIEREYQSLWIWLTKQLQHQYLWWCVWMKYLKSENVISSFTWMSSHRYENMFNVTETQRESEFHSL